MENKVNKMSSNRNLHRNFYVKNRQDQVRKKIDLQASLHHRLPSTHDLAAAAPSLFNALPGHIKEENNFNRFNP